MKTYHDLMKYILDNGTRKEDRTGTGTLSIFGYQMRFDLQEGFPLLTTKKMHLKSIIYELLWFLKGDTNIKYLQDHGVSIWNEWANEKGDLGKVYGHQWRRFGEVIRSSQAVGYEWDEGIYIAGQDQISSLIEGLNKSPFSRRHIITAWNPRDIPEMALPPCHCLFQFNVRPDNNGCAEFLDCQLYQRSADVFLGIPFNIASYALLTMMVSQVVGLKPGCFIHSLGDAHIYLNHIDQVKEQLNRDFKKLPNMIINSQITNIFDFKYEDFRLENYESWPPIKAPIAI